MDLDETRTLIALDTAGTVSAAAAQLQVSRATVRRRLAALEARVGVPLAISNDEGVVLTPAGALFVREALPHVRELDALADAAACAGREPMGCLDLSITAGAASPLGPRFAASLLERYPALTLRIRASANPLAELDRGADVAFAFKLPEQGEFRTRAVGSIGFGLYASTEYVERFGAPRSVKELREHPCLQTLTIAELSELPGVQTGSWPLRRGGVFEFVPRISSPDGAFIRACVLNGQGIGLLPPADAADLVPLLPRVVGVQQRIWAISTQSALLLPRVAACFEVAGALLDETQSK